MAIQQAFTFGKKLQSGGVPNYDQMVKLRQRFPEFVKISPYFKPEPIKVVPEKPKRVGIMRR